jgi:glucose/arabinose dehydrogenase
MAFVGPDDILVSEKASGKVKRIQNGTMLQHPLLDVSVATERERGMLGLAIYNKTHNGVTGTYVLVYFTESKKSIDGSDNCPPPEPYYCEQEKEPLGNRMYRYELVNNNLINPMLILDLPAKPGPNHNGGVIAFGSDGYIYAVVGDLLSYYDTDSVTKAQNIKDSKNPDGRGGILRVTEDGNAVGNGILGNSPPLDKYYAYGIRNSFGIDFDPVTGHLWDTENGPAYGDEINLVRPGFNSGWFKIQGIWEPVGANDQENVLELEQSKILLPLDVDMFVNFNGKGTYSPPEFTWNNTVGPTALKFLTSDKLGQEYKNDLFVGDITNGNIYHFDLNKDRTELILSGKLSDKVADTSAEINESNIIFGQGFEGITDIEVGPYDGYLYVLSYRDGALYRIVKPTD